MAVSAAAGVVAVGLRTYLGHRLLASVLLSTFPGLVIVLLLLLLLVVYLQYSAKTPLFP